MNDQFPSRQKAGRLVGVLIVLVLAVDSPVAAGAENSAGSSGDAAAAPEAPAELRPLNTYMGRTIAPTMHFSGAGWLTRPTREREEAPGKLLKALAIKPGQTICDFGCGNGYHTLELAKRVGPHGLVYAIDIQPEMLELLEERAGPRGLNNIRPLLATQDDPALHPATYDMVLMVDVYHELSDPAAILAAVRESLKPNGRLVLVEFREEDPTVPILPLHKMSQQQVMKEVPPNGFKLVNQYNRLPWQHVLQFARGDSRLPAVELEPWIRDD